MLKHEEETLEVVSIPVFMTPAMKETVFEILSPIGRGIVFEELSIHLVKVVQYLLEELRKEKEEIINEGKG